MILDSTVRKLQIILAAAKATLDMPIVVDAVDLTSSSTTPLSLLSTTNGVTIVDFVPAPLAASTQRKINAISVYNRDTAPCRAQIFFNDNGTQYQLQDVNLNVDDVLGYTDTRGWYVIDGSGNMKTAQVATTTLVQNIDGGNASSVYAAIVKVDGGGA